MRRFFRLRKEINEFLREKGKKESDLIAHPRWLGELAFLSDITEHLNILNVKLQAKENLISDMFAKLKAFLSKFDLSKHQIAKGDFTHFSNCKTLASDNETGLGFDLEKYNEGLVTLQSGFTNRFCDFQKHETVIRLFENPFVVLPTNVDSCFQLELIELQASLKWQDLYKECKVAEFYLRIPDDFAKLKENAAIMLTVFGSTYVCEQTFSRMKIVKSKIRSRLTDKHLHDILRMSVTNFNVNFDVLCKNIQQQGSRQNFY